MWPPPENGQRVSEMRYRRNSLNFFCEISRRITLRSTTVNFRGNYSRKVKKKGNHCVWPHQMAWFHKHSHDHTSFLRPFLSCFLSYYYIKNAGLKPKWIYSNLRDERSEYPRVIFIKINWTMSPDFEQLLDTHSSKTYSNVKWSIFGGTIVHFSRVLY